MINKYRSGIVPLMALFVLVWTSCRQDRSPCLTPKIASLNVRTIRIASHTDTTVVDSALKSALFFAMTATGDKGTIYPSQSVFTLSLAPVADTCQWRFTTDTTGGGNFDTLTFSYKRNLQFISNACGFAYFYELKHVRSTAHFIDSLRITNTNVTNNVNTSHLQVFIHPNF